VRRSGVQELEQRQLQSDDDGDYLRELLRREADYPTDDGPTTEVDSQLREVYAEGPSHTRGFLPFL
jgi:hypothetical protein